MGSVISGILIRDTYQSLAWSEKLYKGYPYRSTPSPVENRIRVVCTSTPSLTHVPKFQELGKDLKTRHVRTCVFDETEWTDEDIYHVLKKFCTKPETS